MNARASTNCYSTVLLVRGMRCAPQRLRGASILPCQGREQDRHGSNEEDESQPQQDLRYEISHDPQLGY
jgi:hypothetical protein